MPTINDNKNDNGDNSKTEQNNKDNASTDMDFIYDNDNDENGNNNEMDEQNNKEDLTTTEGGEKLESSVGNSNLGSRRSNSGGVGTVADIGTSSLASSSSSSSSVDSFESGCKDTVSAAALKLLPPLPVEDNMEDLLATTSSYHDGNDDETPGFQIHTEVEDTVLAPPAGVAVLMTAVNQAVCVVRNINGNAFGLTCNL
eukprot:7007078-Ditylum_brightwellii.AAC.1